MELKATVKVTPNLKKLLDNPGQEMTGAIRAGTLHVTGEIEAKAVKEAPVKTSNLANSITSNVSSDGLKGEVTATAPYGEYVHRGTGLFGPFKQRIKPKTKKALFWPGAEHPFASTKGMRPNPFFARALQKTNVQATFEDGIEQYLKRAGLV